MRLYGSSSLPTGSPRLVMSGPWRCRKCGAARLAVGSRSPLCTCCGVRMVRKQPNGMC